MKCIRQDPDFIRELGPAASAVLVFLFVWNFIMPYIHRLLERVTMPNCRTSADQRASLDSDSALLVLVARARKLRQRSPNTLLCR